MASRKDLVGALDALVRLVTTTDSISQVQRGSLLGHAALILERAKRGLIDQVPWTQFEQREFQMPSESQIKAMARNAKISEDDARTIYFNEATGTLWVNSRYQVRVRKTDSGPVHLSIKRVDQQPIHDWRDLQRIKAELVGQDCEAVELYPANDRVVDTSNQYHLWVVDDPNFRFPFGFQTGLSDADLDVSGVGAAQRERR